MPNAELRLLTVNPRRPARAAVSAAAAALGRGELVLLPTDTVYGLAALPGFENRLREAKGRDAGKPIALLAESFDAVARLVEKMPVQARELARRFWPGPLTMVLPVGTGTEGFRVPDHAVTRAVLAASGGLLRVTSANLSGSPDALDATTALAALEQSVSVALDAGPAPGGLSSTVVEITSGGVLRVLRESALPASWITDPDIVLMVCTGNTCRSPMAEVVLQKWLGNASSWAVYSAGLAALEGSPVSRASVAVAKERGLDLNGQTSRILTAARVDAASVIVVMTDSQRDALRRRFPAARSKVLLLRDFAPGSPGDDIADPVGMPLAEYRCVCDAIEAAMPDLVLYLREKKR
ncbi:MAG: Sua5/YciO/YrdC/YwlC family protein [bacterium]